MKRLLRFERARSLLPAEDGRVAAPAPYFSYRFVGEGAKFGNFGGAGEPASRDIAKILSKSASAARVRPRTRLWAKSVSEPPFAPF